jgi:hypothetical protein
MGGLRDDVLELARTGEVSLETHGPYGRKFEVDGILGGSFGRSALVRSVWIIRTEEDFPRLVTVFPRVSLMFKVLDTVVLTRDVPEAGLRRGDFGAIVEAYGPNAFGVEFVAASGRTQALITLTADDIRHVGDGDLVSVRPLERAAG